MIRIIKTDTSTKRTISFNDKYFSVRNQDIPEKYKTVTITFKEDEIQDYDVIFFHRFLKRIYGPPSSVKVKELPQKNGKVSYLGHEWRYFLSTQSNHMILIETKDHHTSVVISHVLQENKQLLKDAIREGEKFINALLLEAKRLEKQIYNPKKEFEKGEGIQFYLLHNVYLYNYGSAELMVEYSETNENEIKTEYLRYDARTDYDDSLKRAHIDKFARGVGMYYASAVSYYFMALEGFINLIYHAFMKPEFRDKELNLEERFDIEQKLRLMPSLCDGFRKHLDRKSAFFTNFKNLKKYRNQIFHSKIQDLLMSIGFVESSFLYTTDLDKKTKQLLHARKFNLNKENVLTVKSIVDNTILDILSRMTDKYKNLTHEFIMKDNEVPFWKDKSGLIQLGKLDSGR